MLPFKGGRERAPSCLWLPFIGMKGGRQEGKVSGQVKNKLSKIHCSASKQKLVEFKLTELRSISFHLVIY